MKIFTVLIILNCLFSNAYAQKIELEVGQIVYANYQTGQIQPNPFTRFKFRVQGEQNTSFRKIGGGGRVIRPYIAKNPQAVKYLDKYRNKRTMAILSGLAAAGSFIAFAGINLKYLGENNKPNNTDNLKTQVPWLLGFTTGFTILDLVLAGTSNKDLLKAVQLYNDRAPYGSIWRQSPAVTVNVGINNNGVALKIRF